MISLKDLILSFDFESIEFDEQDDIIDEANKTLDYKWSHSSDDTSMTNQVIIDHQTYDHVWLIKKVKRHVADFMQTSGLESKALALGLLEILKLGGNGIIS
jgi:hypothetical protein